MTLILTPGKEAWLQCSQLQKYWSQNCRKIGFIESQFWRKIEEMYGSQSSLFAVLKVSRTFTKRQWSVTRDWKCTRGDLVCATQGWGGLILSLCFFAISVKSGGCSSSVTILSRWNLFPVRKRDPQIQSVSMFAASVPGILGLIPSTGRKKCSSMELGVNRKT